MHRPAHTHTAQCSIRKVPIVNIYQQVVVTQNPPDLRGPKRQKKGGCTPPPSPPPPLSLFLSHTPSCQGGAALCPERPLIYTLQVSGMYMCMHTWVHARAVSEQIPRFSVFYHLVKAGW